MTNFILRRLPKRGPAVALLVLVIATVHSNSCPNTDAADAKPPRDFEVPGTRKFTKMDLGIPNTSGKGGETLSARAYIPTDGEQLPLILMLPGFGGRFETYEQYSTHLASHGNVVLGVTFSGLGFVNPDGQHDKLLTQVRNAIEFALDRFAGKVDRRRIGIVGHSLGGKLAFYAAAAFNGSDPATPHVSLAVGLDPVNSGGPPCFIAPAHCKKYPVAPNPSNGDIGMLDRIAGASLILRSKPDLLTNPDAQFNAYHFYFGSDDAGLHGVPSPAMYVDMNDASHASYALPYHSERNQVPRIVKRTLVAWIKKHFEGAADVDANLTGRWMKRDLDQGLVASVTSR